MRHDDKLDYLTEPDDRRKYMRFRSTAFLGVPVNLNPLPPFFGDATLGHLIDLSAGGMAVLIQGTIPKETKLHLVLTFPDRSLLETDVRICRSSPYKDQHSIGIEFLNLPNYMQEKIKRMTKDFLECEARIKAKAKVVCHLNCSFFNICDKEQKLQLTQELDRTLQLKLQMEK